MPTKIEWCDESWNPLTGCSQISEGCRNCYAERMSKRLKGRFGYPEKNPFRVTRHPDKFIQPVRWKKSRRIFVCSMGDLFHRGVGYDDRVIVWNVMERTPQHTYLILTKRPARMVSFLNDIKRYVPFDRWPLPNVHLGVSVENQAAADERIPDLMKCPAAVRFVSCEPLLGRVDLWDKVIPSMVQGVDVPPIDGVIVGGETGPWARYMNPDWARYLRDQCVKARVPFFLKQMHGKLPIPKDLLIRELPNG